MPAYFAYGSNLLTQRLLARCPGLAGIGTGHLQDFQVAFTKYSWMDGSGKATLAPSTGARAHGVLYELPEGDVEALDAIEGVGKGYERIEAVEVVTGGIKVTAFSYIASDPRDGQRPFDWYLALILAGCLEWDLPTEAQRAFRQTLWDTDPQPDRPGRKLAIAALDAAGHNDWLGLLTR